MHADRGIYVCFGLGKIGSHEGHAIYCHGAGKHHDMARRIHDS